MAWETVDRARGARAAPHPHQDVLRLPHDVRRSAEHQRLPGLPRPARRAAGAQRRGGPARRARRRSRSAARCTRPASSPARTTSIPTCPRATRSRSSIGRSRPAAGSTFESPERGRIEVGITRLHVEEDAGKLLHDRFPGKTAVDLNRAGMPLAEIVSEPDLRSPAEARAYLATLRQILVYAGVSECSMEQGSLRVDANISIRRPGEPKLGTKTEVKNLNSFANVERALEAERERQIGAARARRARGPGDAALQRGHRAGQAAALEGGEPRLPLLPRSRPAAAGARAGVDRRAARRPARAARGAARPARGGATACRPTMRASSPARSRWRSTSSRWSAAGVEPKTAANWVMGDVMTTFNETGAFPVDAGRLAGLVGAGARRRGEPPGGQAGLHRAGPATGRRARRPWPSGWAWCR